MEGNTTYSVSQAGDIAGVSVALIRNWTGQDGQFAKYLSESGAAPAGQERRFTQADLELLYTVARLRKGQNIPYEQIPEYLDSGSRFELPESAIAGDSPQAPAAATLDENQKALALAIMERATVTEARWQNQVERLQAQLTEQAQQHKKELLESEAERARLQGQLDVLLAMQETEQPSTIARVIATLRRGVGLSD